MDRPKPPTGGTRQAEPLRILRYVDLEFECEALDGLTIRRFVTNTIRGGFGYRLKELICVSPQRDCPTCALRPSCIYTRTFETEHTQLPSDGPRLSPPAPYVFDFPDWNVRLEPGELFRFGFRVFGDVTAYVPYFIVALFQLGESGIGKDLTRFRIVRVRTARPMGEFEDLFQWGEPVRKPVTQELPFYTDGKRLHSVSVIFRTPMRIKKDGRILKEIHLPDLVHAAERRLSLLQRFYDPDRSLPPVDVSSLADIRIEDAECLWVDWSRTSTRTEQKMTWGGVVGRMRLTGPVGPVAQILLAASKTNIGSKTAFGLGAIDVRLAG